ncbi:hypothetical protein VYU27_001127 [Nannochloropsis oceanica]
MAPQKEAEQPLLGSDRAEEGSKEELHRNSGGPAGSAPAACDKAHADYVLLSLDEESKHQEAASTTTGSSSSSSSTDDQKSDDPLAPVPLKMLFYFADRVDILLMCVGSLAAVGTGCIMPIFALIFSNTINAINVGPDEERRHNATRYSLLFIGLATVSLVINFVQSSCFSIAAERQVRKMREQFLAAVLRQEIGWFDQGNSGQLSTRIKGDTLLVQQGIGEKMGLGVQFFATFVAGFVIGFSKGWKLALVMCSVVPLLGVSAAFLFGAVGKLTTLGQKLYAEAGSVAEQAISSIRTVAAFTGERREADRYTVKILKAQSIGVKSGRAIAQGLGTVLFIIFASYGLGMWFGAKEIVDDHEAHPECVEAGTCNINGGDVLVVFWSILFASMSIGQCGPQLSAVAEAKGAAAKLIEIVTRIPAIDSEDQSGEKLEHVQGKIEFKDVSFTYPTRPDAPIFQGFSLVVEPGQTVALVGSSGSGKSTVVNLMERFYDPSEGEVLVDGTEIKKLNLKYWRGQVGLVSQEPTLFATSIAQNIAYGSMKTVTMPEGEKEGGKEHAVGGVPMAQIVEAAKAANAHDFIMSFPDGYATTVGEMGVQLSGGQRQRISIARAIIKDPAILLLDEATSALDNKSEKVVQEALDKLVAMRRRTTIIVAHRLSTIRNADVIVVLRKGRIVEQGKHDELMAMEQGHYRGLVRLQTLPNFEGGKEGGMSRTSSTASFGSGMGSRVTSSNYLNGNAASAGAAADSAAATVAAANKKMSGKKTKEEEDEGEEDMLISPKKPRSHHNISNPSSVVVKSNASDDSTLDKVDRNRLWNLSRPEWKWVGLALTMAVVNGCTFPAYSFLLSNIVSYLYDPDPHVVRQKAFFWAGMFPILAAVVAGATFTQLLAFTVMGERVTTRLRDMMFRATVRQDIAYFDKEENSTGAITARLATEVTLVKNVTGQNLGRSVQNLVTIAAAFTIAFAFGSLKMSLVLLGILPLMVIGSFAQMKALRANTDASQDRVAKSGAVAVQAISGIRTVTAFGMNTKLLSLYSQALQRPMELGIKSGLLKGITLGMSQFISLSSYGLLFWYGSTLVLDSPVEERGSAFQHMLRSLMAVTMSAQSIGQNTSFLGDQAAANSAAARIFAVVDRHPEIDSSEDGKGLTLPTVNGRLELKNVDFTYPSRPEAKIFKKFNLAVEAGTTVALVGASGSGKSTVVQLVERYYDPQRGSVTLDGHDLKGLNVRWLRQQIGLVSQEPILFVGTIAENIAYGLPSASRESVIAAAKAANAHDFILSFPSGYETEVGDRGIQLSGGQKQRISIARAILKDPAILLLDEATSALDSESEAVVQEALDNLMQSKKRTTIVVAHRLSTIRNADMICVVSAGRVVEQGTHEELSAQPDSQYALLCRMST